MHLAGCERMKLTAPWSARCPGTAPDRGPRAAEQPRARATALRHCQQQQGGEGHPPLGFPAASRSFRLHTNTRTYSASLGSSLARLRIRAGGVHAGAGAAAYAGGPVCQEHSASWSLSSSTWPSSPYSVNVLCSTRCSPVFKYFRSHRGGIEVLIWLEMAVCGPVTGCQVLLGQH